MLESLSISGFENQEALYLIPAAWVVVFLLLIRSRSELHPALLFCTGCLRGLVLTLILATVAGPYRVQSRLDPVRWIVVRDVSSSLPPASAAGAKSLMGRMKSLETDTELEEIRFGRTTAARPEDPDPEPDASDPREALQWARARILPERRNRVVFLTDGRFSHHLIASDWPGLPGVPVGVYRASPPREPGPDPRARALLIPPRTDEGAPFVIEARFVSDGGAEGIVKLQGPVQKTLRRALRFPGPGERSVTFCLEPLEKGTYPLRILLESPGDREPGNNALEATLVVGPKPQVLVLDEAIDGRSGVRAALEAQGFQVETGSDLPRQDLSVYRAILVQNRRNVLPASTLEALLHHVETGGGGLVLAGGPLGRGLYAYAGTPLEEALPLIPLPPPAPEKPVKPEPDASPPKKKPGKKPSIFESRGKASSITLILLIDKSGSMNRSLRLGDVPPIQLAKEAAISTAEALSSEDRIGVIAFDHRNPPFQVVELGPAGDRTRVAQKVARLNATGGTRYLPALRMAFTLMQQETSRIKHVIMLTDGQRDDSEQSKNPTFRRLVERMRDRRITLSTLGVGREVDLEFVQSLSTWGRGEHQWATSAQEITTFYTLEADRLLARAGRKGKRRKNLNPDDLPGPRKTQGEEKTGPDRKPPEPGPGTKSRADPPAKIPVRMSRAHPVLAGLPGPIPPIQGHDEVRLRPMAWVGIETREGVQPILATAPFGLGRVMVLTTDLGGSWTRGWLEWKGFGPLVAQAMRYVARPPGPAPRLPREGRCHGPELDLTGNDPFGLGRLDQVTGSVPLPPLKPGTWPGEASQSQRKPLPPLGLLLALLLFTGEILVRRLSR